MKNKTYLFPHLCQKIGWWFVGASLFIGLAMVALESVDITVTVGTLYRTMMSVLVFLLHVAMLLICLSQEKEEDEYIQSVRARSVFIVVIFGFVVKMLFSGVIPLILSFCPPEVLGRLSFYFYFPTDACSLSIVYLVIFKGSMYVDYLRSKRNGE